MRLESLTADHVRRAIAIYKQLAWPEGGPPSTRIRLDGIESAQSLPQLLAFLEPSTSNAEHDRCRRYTLRLGNQRYPFMKFVVQEYLVKGEFFFSVDTHDNLDIRANAPDFLAWEELKNHNRQLKAMIEARWAEANLPTNEDLRHLVEEIAKCERETSKRRRLLVVDDEVDVARGLGALLEARGYQVELAHDGPSALARLARDPRPDLLLLDFEMPGCTGEEVLARLRAQPRLADLPVLVSTASSIELERVSAASGFLRKPYPRQLLFALLERLLPSPSNSCASGLGGGPLPG